MNPNVLKGKSGGGYQVQNFKLEERDGKGRLVDQKSNGCQKKKSKKKKKNSKLQSYFTKNNNKKKFQLYYYIK